MMYKVAARPMGPFISQLQSDTLFGAFCWSWLRRKGQTSLEEEIIGPCLRQTPPIIFSNAFPGGTLPLPMGVTDLEDDMGASADRSERKAACSKARKRKRLHFLPAEECLRLAAGEGCRISDKLMGEGVEEFARVHSIVGRNKGKVGTDRERGGLFAVEETLPAPNTKYDIYLISSLDPEDVRATLSLMMRLGLGADKSNGKGRFELAGFASVPEWPKPPGANAFMALSNFIPAPDDPTEGRWRVLVKYGKLDRELAESAHPFRMPLLYMKSGSVFRTDKVKPFYGRCLDKVAVADRPVIVNACTLALPMVVPADF